MKKFCSNYKLIIKLLLISFVFLAVGSKNSFLYKINDWYDANAFLTMGKGIIHGLVPYKDLFEQKGPVLYFIYAIAALINDSSFIGVFILEIISFTVFLYYARKIIVLLAKEQYANFSLIILTGAIMLLKPFGHGGSVEEFIFPLLTISLYSFIKLLYTGKVTNKEMILNGIIAGLILWMKYSLLGFHIFFGLSLFVIFLKRGNVIEVFKRCLSYLLGMFIITIPILLYFICNNALSDLFKVYFYTNIHYYSSTDTLVIKLINSFNLLFSELVLNKPFFIMIVILGFFLLLRKSNYDVKGSKAFIILSLIALGLGVFIGGKAYFYYSLIIAPFMIFGDLAICYLLHFFDIRMNIYRELSILVIMLGCVFIFGTNTPYMFYDKDYYAQYEFLDKINEEDDQSIINYGFLDGGFYLTTNSTPHYYYFMRNNLTYKDYPIMYSEQKKYIREEKPMFVVSTKLYVFLSNQGYYVVDSHTQHYEDRDETYYLYQKKAA